VTRSQAHVAIVEDDAAVRRALVRVLAAAGFRVSSYVSAEEFLAIASQPAPDCVVIDLHLPSMGGLELHDYLHEIEPDVSVVLITADYELAQSEPLRSHTTPCLTKPIDEHTLLEAIVRVTPAARRAR
jgi:FixJ family two-component response regulator